MAQVAGGWAEPLVSARRVTSVTPLTLLACQPQGTLVWGRFVSAAGQCLHPGPGHQPRPNHFDLVPPSSRPAGVRFCCQDGGRETTDKLLEVGFTWKTQLFIGPPFPAVWV